MKKLFITGLLLSCVIWTASTSGQSKDEPLRVLVTYGNHDFEEPLFWAMLDAMPGIEYTKLDLHEAMTACDHLTIVNGKPVYDCKLPPAASTLAPGLAEKFDVVLRYDMLAAWPAAQQAISSAMASQWVTKRMTKSSQPRASPQIICGYSSRGESATVRRNSKANSPVL